VTVVVVEPLKRPESFFDWVKHIFLGRDYISNGRSENPVLFSDYSREADSVTTFPTDEGLKIALMRGNRSIMYNSELMYAPESQSTMFSAVTEGEKTFLHTQYQGGAVYGRLGYFGEFTKTFIQLQTSAQSDGVIVEGDYKGRGWAVETKYQYQSQKNAMQMQDQAILSASFSQQISQAFTLGAEVMQVHKIGSLGITYGARWEFKPQRSFFALKIPAAALPYLTYTHRLSRGIMAATIGIQGTPEGKFETQACFGLELRNIVSSYMARLSLSDWKLGIKYEENMGAGKAIVAFELDIPNGKPTFGIGYTFVLA